jgi:adenylate kinase
MQRVPERVLSLNFVCWCKSKATPFTALTRGIRANLALELGWYVFSTFKRRMRVVVLLGFLIGQVAAFSSGLDLPCGISLIKVSPDQSTAILSDATLKEKLGAKYVTLLGAAGSGKGTLAKPLSQMTGWPHISMGEILRAEEKKGTALGQQVGPIMKSGQLIPSSLIKEILQTRLADPDLAGGALLDAIPRRLEEKKFLFDGLEANGKELDAVILLKVSEEKAIARLTGRRICGKCGVSYHLEFMPPKKAEVCDKCEGPLISRADDGDKSVIQTRQKVYQEEIGPIVEALKDRLFVLDAEADSEKVLAKAIEILLNPEKYR